MSAHGRLCSPAHKEARVYRFDPVTRNCLCCHCALESALTPILTLTSILLNILCVSAHSWVKGETDGGAPVARVSPWWICASPCPGGDCVDHRSAPLPGLPLGRPTQLDCFWMSDWTGTEFSGLTAVQQLEYWCLGSSLLALCLCLVTCLDTRGRLCPPYCTKACVALLFISFCQSVAAITVFVTNLPPGLTQLADNQPIHVTYSWTFYLRCCSTALFAASSLCAGIHWWKTRFGDYYGEDDEDDRMTIVSLNADDMEDQWSDVGEQL